MRTTTYKQVKVDENLRYKDIITTHGKHFLIGNSGILSKKNFKRIEDEIQKIAEEKLCNVQTDTGFFSIQREKKITQKQEKFANQADEYFIKHGGGSIWEYAKIAQIRKQKLCILTLHESRMLGLLYSGEEELAKKNIARGVFIFACNKYLQEKAEEIKEKLGVRIEYNLELENFGKGAWGDKMRALSESRNDENFFARRTLSNHFMRVNPNKEKVEKATDIDFIDGNEKQFKKILDGHKITLQDLRDEPQNIAKLIRTYVIDTIEQIKREGQESMVLGHLDLIKAKIFTMMTQEEKSEDNLDATQALKRIEKAFQEQEIQDLYEELFDAVNEKNMIVELNLSGVAKGVGVYGIQFLGMMKRKNIKVTVGSDSHEVEQEDGAKKIFEKGMYGKNSLVQVLQQAEIECIWSA